MLDDAIQDEEVEEGLPAWMATFSDLATLLLTFFVLLLSFANLDVQNFQQALGSVKEAFGVEVDAPGNFEAKSTSPVELSQVISTATVLDAVKRYKEAALNAAKAFVKARGMEDQVEVLGTPRGIVLRMKDVVLFENGSGEVLKQGEPVLDMVAELYERFEGEMGVLGHTDDRPIHTVRYPTNWELSTSRATSAMRYIVAEVDADASRIHVGGYAHMRPIADNKTAAGRASNRRVEFVFEYPMEIGESGKELFDVEETKEKDEGNAKQDEASKETAP